MSASRNPYEKMQQAAEAVREARREHREQVQSFAKANRDYHKGRSLAYLKAKGTIPEREAHRDIETADLRYKRDLAEGLLKSALEAVISCRQELSMWQSVSAAAREGVASEWIMAGEEVGS